jgi:DNA-binding transcriptional LysR family regulator
VIDKLEFLIALAREQHFGRAAETCSVTQPTFSAGIKQLEDTLGVLLVQRGSRFHSFTPEGERVLEWARRIAVRGSAFRWQECGPSPAGAAPPGCFQAACPSASF